MGDTHITGRHIGGGTHITSDMCAGIHISPQEKITDSQFWIFLGI